MELRRLRRSDFGAVIALSVPLFGQYNDEAFPLNRASCLAMLNGFLSTPKSYFKGLFIDDKLSAWMYCSPGHHYHHSYINGMSQIYYHSDLTGFSAVRALTKMHEDYFNHAEKMKFQTVSTSSYLENYELFERILEQAGWRVTGPGRLVRLTHYHPEFLQRQRLSGGQTDPGAMPGRSDA